MVIPKCPKTTTGKHHWLRFIPCEDGMNCMDCPERVKNDIPECKYCHLMDDRKKK